MEGESGNVQITRIENTKESLAVYKELIAVSWEFLTWKHEWYSILLVVAVTSVYSLIWWNDITVLSALSLLGIAAVCLDLICMHGRGFLATLIPWSNAREREYTDFCIWVSEGSTKVTSAVSRMARFRETNPLIYYAGAATVLLICAWIGSSVPNMLLCYWATVALVLAPGIVRNGLIAKYFAQVYVELHKLLRRYLPAKKSAGDANKEE